MPQFLVTDASCADQTGKVAVGVWVFRDLLLARSPAVDIVPSLGIGVRQFVWADTDDVTVLAVSPFDIEDYISTKLADNAP